MKTALELWRKKLATGQSKSLKINSCILDGGENERPEKEEERGEVEVGR